MTGERVTALIYGLALEPESQYRPETQGTVTLDGFNGELSPERCRFTSTEHFESEQQARARLEPQLAAWRQWVILDSGSDWLPFRFLAAEREPWPPPAPGSVAILVSTAEMCMATDSVSASVTRSQFPNPAPPFEIDACTAVGLELLRDARRSPSHVLKFAYAFLSLLELEHQQGGSGHARDRVAHALNVGAGVVSDFGRLCTHGGTGAEARVFKRARRQAGQGLELTPTRREWVFRAFAELVRRQGQWAAGAIPVETFYDPAP